MSDIGLYGLAWALVALITTGVAALGLALQPIVVLVVRRGRGAAARHVLGSFIGPLLATILGALSLLAVELVDTDAKQALDSVALVLPVVALAIWIAFSVALLRGR